MSTTSRQPETEVAPVSEIRQHFPALERVHNGYQVAYFDGPGGTQVPRYVVELDKPLPRMASGKIAKRILKELLPDIPATHPRLR